MRVALISVGLLYSIFFAGAAAATDISQLVAQVSQANLSAHVAALEGDRSTPAAQAVAAEYITQQLESYGYTVAVQPVAGSANLTATIIGGTQPSEEFVLGAHFDTVAGTPGADDNASGVAAVLEAARVLSGEPLASTLHFVFFALEESGYQGSEAYAGALGNAGANVVGMISLDMIGYTCSTPGCQIIVPSFPGCLESYMESDVGDFIGAGANTASLPLLNAFMANTAAYQPSLPVEHFVIQGTGTCFSDSRRSDHKSFWDEGYPAIVLGDGANSRTPHYHQSTDVLATLDLDFMTSVTRAVVGHVASASTPLAVPGLGGAGLAALASSLLGVGALGARRRPSA